MESKTLRMISNPGQARSISKFAIQILGRPNLIQRSKKFTNLQHLYQ